MAIGSHALHCFTGDACPAIAPAIAEMLRAPRLGETTGSHHTCTDGEDAEGDEEAECVLAVAVGSSATAVIVAPSAARRSAAALHLRLGLFGHTRGGLRGCVIRNTASDMRCPGSFVRATPPWARTLGPSHRPCDRPVHARMVGD